MMIIIIIFFLPKYHLDLDFIFLGWAKFLLGKLFLNFSYHIIRSKAIQVYSLTH
jgi:hypothetical protein